VYTQRQRTASQPGNGSGGALLDTNRVPPIACAPRQQWGPGWIAIAWYGLGSQCRGGASPVKTRSSHTNRLLTQSGNLMAMTVHLEFVCRPLQRE
jgi:hypothetical protein